MHLNRHSTIIKKLLNLLIRTGAKSVCSGLLLLFFQGLLLGQLWPQNLSAFVSALVSLLQTLQRWSVIVGTLSRSLCLRTIPCMHDPSPPYPPSPHLKESPPSFFPSPEAVIYGGHYMNHHRSRSLMPSLHMPIPLPHTPIHTLNSKVCGLRCTGDRHAHPEGVSNLQRPQP